MSSKMLRIGVVGLAIILAVAIASAQERHTTVPAERQGTEVFNPVEGRVVVLSSRPDGARVETGEIICELDPSECQDRLANYEITIKAAEADVQGARLAREVAEVSVIQYVEGIFRQELAQTTSEIKLAESKLSRSEDHVEWCRRMFEKGYASLYEKVTEELALQQARVDLESAQSKRQTLIQFTKDKSVKTLKGQVETARGRELAKQAALERERLSHKRLTDQIRRCKVAAPVAGRVRYTSPFGAGAVLRDGQLLCRIEPDGEARTPEK
jgi:multidrug resistance efflux pump